MKKLIITEKHLKNSIFEQIQATYMSLTEDDSEIADSLDCIKMLFQELLNVQEINKNLE